MGTELFSQAYFLPHGHCYLWQPALLWTHFATDLLIGLSYVAISATLYFLVRKIKLPFSPVVLAFGAFIAACGATHFIEVWTLWRPYYWLAAAVKVATAIASVTTAVWLFRLRHQMYKVAKSTEVAEERRVALETLNAHLEERVHQGIESSRTSEDQMRLISDATPSFIGYIDREERYRFVNKYYERAFHLSKAQILGKKVEELMGPELYAPRRAHITCALGGKPVTFTSSLPGVGRRNTEVIVNYVPDFDPKGIVRGFVVLTQDVTEHKLAERESLFLRQVSDTLAKSLDFETTLWSVAQLAIPDIADVCWIDVAGEQGLSYRAENLKDVEGNAELTKELRGYSLPLVETILPSLQASKDQSLLITEINEKAFAPFARNPAYVQSLKRLKITSFLALPLARRGRDLGVICLATIGKTKFDTYELKLAFELAHRSSFAIDNALLYLKQIQATEDLTRSQGELEKAVRVRDDFLSIASHELRTPLTNLKLQNQIRQRKLKKNDEEFGSQPQVEKMLSEDSKQIDRLNRLVDDMLDITRLHTGKLTLVHEIFDLGELLREVAERFQLQFSESDSELSFDLANGVIVQADRYRVEQVISNLLTNALRYGAGKPVTVAVSKEITHAKLRVIDRGIGIAKENQERIFRRFERAVSINDASGLGLGLYIVKQILEAHGGAIHVESELDAGSVFIAELPLYSGGTPDVSPPQKLNSI